ncbi:MAG: Gldg family protein [Blautia sp.]|nr:Gldg family protein [Blautia sp.]MCM1200614.1 Gldg family protein [Bacteroides fragilis]
MAAIYKREVKAFFHSFIGWLYLAAMFLMMGIYFTYFVMLYGEPSIVYVLQGNILPLQFAIPILSMRSLAEERKQKTDQLILTAPVSVIKIILGKYLALLTVYAIPAAVVGITPLILSFFGEFRMGVSYTALLGFFLYGAFALAAGLFFSSLTESPVIAAVLTFAVLFLGYLMSGICSMISQTGNFLTRILSFFDMAGRFDAMTGGSLYIPSAVYYVSMALFFLFCAAESVQKRRYSASGGGLKTGAFNAGLILATAVLTVMVNILADKMPENMRSLDVTSNKMYTLTEETKAFVSGLTEDIRIYVMAGGEYKDENLDKTLRKLEALSEHLTVTYVDPLVNPQFYSNYAETEPDANSLIVVGPARSRVVDYYNMYGYSYNSYYEYQITGYDGEGQIVSALEYVTTDTMPKVYAVGGHNELELEGQFQQAVQKKNIECEPLLLLSVEEVPEDAQAVILNAPLNDYSEDDVDKITAYLERGGNAIIIPAWTDTELPNFERILDYYGISVTEGIVLEENADAYYGQIPYLIFPRILDDEMTQSVAGAVVFTPYAQGLLYDDTAEDIVYVPLLETSGTSYSKAYQQEELEIVTEFGRTENDTEGPFVIALRAEKTVGNNEISNGVIVAVEFFFTEDADSIVPGSNVRVFGDIMGALVEEEGTILIPMKLYSPVLTFSTRTAAITGLLSVAVLPICLLAAGFIIWFRRRKA